MGGRMAVRRGAVTADRAVAPPRPVTLLPDRRGTGGAPLPQPARALLEDRLGHDFSSVRVHTDRAANGSAAALGARAYTVGEHIAFADRQYRPETAPGQRLLAHELDHVVRFRQGRTTGDGPLLQPVTAGSTSTAEPAAEREAADAGTRVHEGPSAATAGLRVSLEMRGRTGLFRLLDQQPFTLTPPFTVPRLVPDASLPGAVPVRGAFGPFSPDAALRLLDQVPEKPDWFADMLRQRQRPEYGWDLWVVYENDGSGIVPNFGSGSDQGRTAALYIYGKRRRPALGLSRVGVTAIEMTTPRGELAPGAPFGSESTYRTAPGPYSGVASLDVGVTVARGGNSSVEVSASVGVDSQAWGKLVQDFIHTKLSDSPLFPWPTGTKPLVEGGLSWHHTINDLRKGDLYGLTYTGRLEFDTAAVTGTRRTEGSLRARFVLRTAELNTPVGALSFEFSPIGALARGFVRYNDGRVAPIAGVEAAVNGSIGVNLGRVGLGLAWEMLSSTDPAFQTGLDAGTGPTGAKLGTVESGPAGHHGTGQVFLRIAF
jgi:Domain of unknown function (DUF4157)